MPDTTTMICPKCHGEMRTYERNGVLVDQCDECRGIFLDRGELEQLLDAQRGPERRDVDDERQHDRHDHGHEHDHDHDHEHEHDHDHEHEHDYNHDGKGRGSRRTRASTFISDLLGGGE